MVSAIKFVDGADDMIEGVGMPFGGPWADGQDLYGEHFSKATDFAFSWFPEDSGRPALFHHGLDADAAISPVGRVKSYEVKADLGVWTKVQLDKSGEYFSAIKDLVKAGKLFFSSGAMAHLVDVDKRSGEIRRWPWVELSLTPTPANLLARVDYATAGSHYKSAGLDLPEALRAVTLARLKEIAGEVGLEATDDSLESMLAEFPENDEAAWKKACQARKRMAKAVTMAAMQRMVADMGADMSEADMQAMLDAHPDADEAEMRRLMEKKGAKAAAPLRAVSWQDVGNEVRKALEDRMATASPFDMGGCICIEETYSDRVIACVWQDGTERYFSVAFSLGPDGHVAAVGPADEVEETYVRKESLQPVALMAWAASRHAASLLERTKDLRQRRLKEGRVISTMNRKRLTECIEAMGGAMKELQALLDSTVPQSAKAAAVRRLRAQLVAQEIGALALN